MKKTLKIKEHLTNCTIYVCFGSDEYLKSGKNHKVVDLPILNCNGIANEITFKDDNTLNCYIVGINDKIKDIYFLKTTIVHELSHIVTYIMKKFGFTCDEFRSYLLAYLYEKTMIWIDKVLNEQ